MRYCKKKAKEMLKKIGSLPESGNEEYKISIIPAKSYLIHYVMNALKNVQEECIWFTQN